MVLVMGPKGATALLAGVLAAAACSSSAQVSLSVSDDTVPAPPATEPDEPPDPVDPVETEPDAPAIDEVPDEDRSPTPPGLIRVDQFGYRPQDPKVAVIADPQVGFDAGLEFEPGEELQVRRRADDEVVHRGRATAWNQGQVHQQSGDRGWWFDFSEVDEPGSYYIVDVDSGTATGQFEIGQDVYEDLLDAALRMFWYNRANTAHPPELSGAWADLAAYVGPGQDFDARSVDDPGNAATARDLSGGWFDAGDTNKYVTFAIEPVHLLLAAYRENSQVFDDELGIPESGNGIPDVIDEVNWELDWLTRMQIDGGAVLTKVGLVDSGAGMVPSQSRLARFYEQACSSSTIAAAAMFAHAAIVFSDIAGLAEETLDYRQRAEAAWGWYQTNERSEDCDPQIVRAGDADMSLVEQDREEVVAAIYLYALTGDPSYDAVVRRNLTVLLPFTDDGWGNYAPNQADALRFYVGLPGAESNTVRRIEERMAELISSSATLGFDPAADLYRAHMYDYSYHWGSNMVKANAGAANLVLEDVPGGQERALGHLHYLHGVNPLALVYLSNMEEFGAERSVQSLFHYWFGENTPYDVGAGSRLGVAPGYLVGGPNASYSGSATPPAGQPPQKSYRDWSSYGSEPSWEVTEPAIYYQAAYVRLLAEVIAS